MSIQEQQLLEHTIEISHIQFHNPVSGFSVLKAICVEDQDLMTVTGVFTSPKERECLKISGSWQEHPKFGKQFKCHSARLSHPYTQEGMIRYLASNTFKGVGPKLARRIVEFLGKDAFNSLDKDPEKLKLVPRLSRKQAQIILETWQAQKTARDLDIFLAEHQIGASLAHKMRKRYLDNLEQVVRTEPYRLIADIRGVGFKTADNIAQSLGFEEDHPKRVEQGILFALKQGETSGHCYLQVKQLQENLALLLDINLNELKKPFENSLITLAEQQKVFQLKHPEHQDIICSQGLYLAEKEIAQGLMALKEAAKENDELEDQSYKIRILKWIEAYNKTSQMPLSDDQSDAIVSCALSPIFVLTGGPGVGKTTTANAIIQLIKAMGKSVILAAPTGRAAQRLQEVSNCPAKTIHRLLEYSAQDHSFVRGEKNKLTASCVIIDEASMLDCYLMRALIKAIPLRSQLILIGDCDQLPSVGPGNILKDMLASPQIPHFHLKKVFRQAQNSMIIRAAHSMNHGNFPEFSKESKADCQFIQASDVDSIKDWIQTLVTKTLPQLNYDPKRDVQILSPMNKGPLGCIQLNQFLQGLLNKDPARTPSSENSVQIRQHDKVIQTANNYDLGVFNGDIGMVIHSNSEFTEVQFENRLVKYKGDQKEDLSLAYAISIHKSQGSEFKVIIIPCSTSHYVMLQRNLMYTGVTRAKKLALFIGDPKALMLAIQNQTPKNRQTLLNLRLQLEDETMLA